MESSCQIQLQKPCGMKKNIETNEISFWADLTKYERSCEHVSWKSLRCWSRFKQKNQNKAVQYWWSDSKSHRFLIPSFLLQLLVLRHLNFLGNRYFKSYSSLYQSWKALPLPIFLLNSQDSWWVYKVSCTTTIRSCHGLFLTRLYNRTKRNIFRKDFGFFGFYPVLVK